MEKDRKMRHDMIQRQVKRIAQHVPGDQLFLICTFKDRDQPDPGSDRRLRGVCWVEEIKRELKRQGVTSWEERAVFVTWGRHKGRNTWRHIRYGFAFGVTQRTWSGDLHLKAKALEGDLVNVGETTVPNAQVEGPASEIAADLQQLIGRLHCRNTTRVDGQLSGQSGETWFWLEMYEPGTRRGLAMDGVIPRRLQEAMPGIRFAIGDEGKVVKTMPPAELMLAAPSAEQQFMDAALEWMAEYQGEVLNTADLTAAVREQCAELVGTVNPKTVARGIAKAKEQLVRSGGWESVSARRLIRSASAVAA